MAEERRDVEEVPGLGPAEQCQDLVCRKLLQGQHRSQVGVLGREQAGVVGQIDLAGLPGRRCAESDETFGHPLALDRNAVALQRRLEGRQEHSHGGRAGGEVVEIPGLAVHDSPNGEAPGAGQRKLRSLRELSHDPG